MLYGLVTLSSIGFNPKSDIPDLTGKVVFITGGNVGLGRETITQLAQHNPSRIFLAARTPSKAQAAITEIQAVAPSAPITFLECDLTSFASIQACCRKFVEQEKRLDLLFLNAGVMAVPPGQTEEGYEIQFGTNHVGHALLTKLLLPTLLKTAERKGSDVRVISVASIGHAAASSIPFDKLKTDGGHQLTWTRYGQSKLANILFARELARRYGDKGITAVSVHPGLVNTELYNSYLSNYGPVGTLVNRTKFLIYTSVAVGAKGQLWAATAKLEEKGGKGRGVKNGTYYTPVGVEGQGTRLAYDDKLAGQLWEWTEKELDGWEL